MIVVRLVVQVSNARDRSRDARLARDCKLPAVPGPGDTIVLNRWRPRVEAVEFVPDSDTVVVRLAADHQSFKGTNFDRLVRKWESVGFRREL